MIVNKQQFGDVRNGDDRSGRGVQMVTSGMMMSGYLGHVRHDFVEDLGNTFWKYFLM